MHWVIPVDRQTQLTSYGISFQESTDVEEEGKEEEFRRNIEHEAYKYSWDRMTEHVERLYGRNEK